MRKKFELALLLLILTAFVAGCATLRYNMAFPEAKGFHPARIGVLPVDVGPYADARGKIDEVIVAAIREQRKITRAVNIGATQEQELREAVNLYLEKMTRLNYSDPELSRQIADIAQVDALIIVTLDFWDYLREGDSKIAKVGLGIKMVNPLTGRLVWEARHFTTDKYLIVKPDLSAAAKSLMKKMAGYMPKR